MEVVVGRPYGVAVRERFWGLWRLGWSVEDAAVGAGISFRTGERWVQAAGVGRRPGRPGGCRCVSGVDSVVGCHDAGVEVDVDAPPGRRLSVREREEIALGRAEKLSVREIAQRLNRSASTVSRELRRNTDTDGRYKVLSAERAAQNRAKRPKQAKLAQPGLLRDYVVQALLKKRSPEQIVCRLRLEYPDNPEMRVCHETIYQAVYVQSRGGLKREVDKALRRGRAVRHTRRKTTERRGRIPGMIPIAERPEDVNSRLVPGNWEGDLIIGKDSKSAVSTLVERTFRYTMLGYLDGDHTAETVRDAVVGLLGSLPNQLRRTLTWDQGHEMACHFEVADQADIEVYFADPHSPWQRGTNENTNGLLRQYMPKGTDLSVHTPDDLQAIADELNDRPRKALGWLTPTEALHLYLGHTVIIGGRVITLSDFMPGIEQQPPIVATCADG